MTPAHLETLGYNTLWLDYQLLSPEALQHQWNEFETGEDIHTEHFRYRTFKHYLQTQTALTDDKIAQLFEVIKTEVDASAARAMGLDLLKVVYLNETQFQLVATHLKSIFGDKMQRYIDKETARKTL